MFVKSSDRFALARNSLTTYTEKNEIISATKDFTNFITHKCIAMFSKD